MHAGAARKNPQRARHTLGRAPVRLHKIAGDVRRSGAPDGAVCAGIGV